MNSRAAATFVAVTALWALIAVIAYHGTQVGLGRWSYALDDAYIHLAMGRQFGDTGIWGLGGHFASASSSPLWTVMLAACELLGLLGTYTPLVANLLLLIPLCALAVTWLTDAGWRLWTATGWIIGAAIVAAVPALVLAGMEHVLQLVFLTAMYLGLRLELQKPSRWSVGLLVVGAAVATATRYECGFSVGAVALALWSLDRRRVAVGTFAAGLAVPILAGVTWFSASGHFLPVSLVVKGKMGAGVNGLSVLRALTWHTAIDRSTVVLFALMLGVPLMGWAARSAPLRWAPWWIAALLHLQLAMVGWLYRYEAWIVWIGLLIVAELPWAPIGRWALAAIGLTSAARGVHAARMTAQAIAGTSCQHRNLADFANDNPALTPVMLNDIGAVAWFSPQSAFIDVGGLATPSVSELWLAQGELSAEDLAREAAVTKPRTALIYASWIPNIPSTWVHIGHWHVSVFGVAADDDVDIYAVDPKFADELAAAAAKPRVGWTFIPE